jgi:hypothetical protein
MALFGNVCFGTETTLITFDCRGICNEFTCQNGFVPLTCHPAIYTGSEMWLEEPFIPQKRKNTLSSLSVQGFPVDHLLEHCRKTYLQWHSERLKGILAFLKSLNPPPSILLFPEGAIPYQCLKIIHKYSSETETTVLAGTHSLQKIKEAKSAYKELGLQEKALRRLPTVYKTVLSALLRESWRSSMPSRILRPSGSWFSAHLLTSRLSITKVVGWWSAPH